MRTLLSMLFASALLCGCAGTRDLFSFAPPARNFSAPGPCGAVARQRLADAIMSDLAEGYEKAIFDRTYQDCLAQQKAGQPAAVITGR